MTKQNEITRSIPLLDSRGRITEEGWARHPLWQYDRRDIRPGWLRIKEWDYYYVLSDDLKKGVTVTLSDLGYAALIAVCWLDFETGEFQQADTIAPLTRGRLFSGESAGEFRPDNGELAFSDQSISLSLSAAEGRRTIRFRVPGFDAGDGENGLEGELELVQPADMESINIATSWAQNRQRFYYNRKINCMPASGNVRVGSRSYRFSPESAFAGLDWGRGAWTYINRWYWSSASGLVDGLPFGFNLGYGFSDRTPASENILFHQGRGHKLGEVSFDFNPGNYMDPWRFTDEAGRLDLEFRPEIDRFGAFNLLAIKSVQHQVFGRFSGVVVLDDGQRLRLDDFLGFAEDVYNRW